MCREPPNSHKCVQAPIAAQSAKRVQCASRTPAPLGAQPCRTSLHSRGPRSLRDVTHHAATSPSVPGSRSGAAPGDATSEDTSTLVLGTAINIASAAVQAYVTPTQGQKYRCRGSNGTTTQFIGSGKFVSSQLNSILKVDVEKFFSKPDLYVEISCGESYARTPSATNTIDPTFDEPLLLFPNQPRGSTLPTDVAPLTVRVFDDDSLAIESIDFVKNATERFGMASAGDDALGSATIELGKGWEDKGTTNHELEIKMPDGTVMGTVCLKLTPSPLGKTATNGAGGEGAAAAEAFKHPKLAVKGGLAKNLQKHVAAATVLQPAVAELAADADDADVKQADAVPLPGALKAAQQDTAPPDAAASGSEISMEEAKKKVQEAWAALPEAFPDAFLFGGEPVAFFDSEFDTQAWMHRNERQKKVVISFRGTQPTNAWDWFTDAMLILQQTTPDPETGGLRTVGDLGGDAKPDGDKAIHQGFYIGYRSVEPQIRQMLAMCTGNEPGWEIITCGHSLGGGLATVCAYDLATSSDIPYPVQAYTFGSPRAGNKAFAAAYIEAVPATFRFHNHNDAVAQVPLLMGYKHVNNQSRLDSFVDDTGAENGLLYMPNENPISVFGGPPVAPEVREKLKAQPGATDGWRVLRRQAQLLRTILSGRAAADHDFDEYMQGLACVMYTASEGENHQEATRALRDALNGMRQAA